MRILSICTGNICRSALAESLLRARLDSGEFDVSSAGVQAVVGGRVPREQLFIGSELGLADLPGHEGRQLTADMVLESDLLLVATKKHRATVVRMTPGAAPRTFTFREFAHLAKTVTAADIEELLAGGATCIEAAVTAVTQQRGGGTPLDNYDVEDPYGRDEAAYRTSAQQLVPAIEDIAKYLNIVLGLSPCREGEQV